MRSALVVAIVSLATATSFAAQPYSLSAPIVAATPAASVEPQPRPLELMPAGGLRRTIALDGPWRFRLESAACGPDESQCEGMVQRWFDPATDDGAWRERTIPEKDL